MDIREIEELIKTANSKQIKAMMRNAAILSDPNISEEMKIQALENIKAISAGNKPKKQRLKPVAPVATPPTPPTQLVQQPVAPAAATTPAATPTESAPYPEGLHLSPLNAGGHDEAAMRGIFDSLPHEEKQHVADWHASTKVQKSIETLFSLFTQLKKHL